MTKAEKQTKILAAIEARGWFKVLDTFVDAAADLKASGLIKLDYRYTAAGGNRYAVWAKA